MTKKRVILAIVAVVIAALAVVGFATNEEFRLCVASFVFAILFVGMVILSYYIKA